MKITKKHLQKGFGLLELMLSMVIVALLLIMATRYYQSAHRSQRVSTAIQQVNAIVGAANEYAITNGGSYGTTTLTMASLDGLMPSSDTNNMNPWGQEYKIASSTPTSIILNIQTGGDAKGCTLLHDALNNIDGLSPAECTSGLLALTINYDGTNAKTS